MSHVVGKVFGGGGGGGAPAPAPVPQPEKKPEAVQDRAGLLERRSEQLRSAASDEGITRTDNDQDQLGSNSIPLPKSRKASARLLGG